MGLSLGVLYTANNANGESKKKIVQPTSEVAITKLDSGPSQIYSYTYLTEVV